MYSLHPLPLTLLHTRVYLVPVNSPFIAKSYISSWFQFLLVCKKNVDMCPLVRWCWTTYCIFCRHALVVTFWRTCWSSCGLLRRKKHTLCAVYILPTLPNPISWACLLSKLGGSSRCLLHHSLIVPVPLPPVLQHSLRVVSLVSNPLLSCLLSKISWEHNFYNLLQVQIKRLQR